MRKTPGLYSWTYDPLAGDGLAEFDQDTVIKISRDFIQAGADILDVGGESTRPGADPVSAQEEMDRVLPIIEVVRREFETLISVDTYKADVAREALKIGANMVNDVWGFRADPALAGVTASAEVPVILMHNRSTPNNAAILEQLGGRYVGIEYDNLVEDVRNELLESVALAHEAGIPDEKIILDPGIGFGKTVEQNLEVLDRLDDIRSLGYPVLLGPSRKSFIGYTLDLPPDDRVEGTAAAVSVGIVRGVDIIRVHDVAEMIRIARMTDAIVRRQ